MSAILELDYNEALAISNARSEGREAYAEGLMYEFCPFPRDSAKRDEWEQGWLDAEAESVASPLY